MAGPIKIAILADAGKATAEVREFGQTVQDSTSEVEASGARASRGFDQMGAAATGANSAIDLTGSALASIDTIQQSSAQKAARLARAQADVEQAMADREQATIDLQQATEDLNQAEIDGNQAAVDSKQAEIDKAQALVDAKVAQEEYAAAVKENGKNSVEARQAAIDLTQAKADAEQADVDATQASADATQAALDGKQAVSDHTQATIDAKTAVLDLADAQRELNPTAVQQAQKVFETYAPLLASTAIAVQALSGSTVVASAATKVWAVAQAALNVVMALNPIGLVIIAIVALVAIFVVAYKKSETFRRIVDGAFKGVLNVVRGVWNWVKGNWPLLLAIITGPIGIAVRFVVKHFDRIMSAVRSIPGKIKGAFLGAHNWLVNAGRNVVRGLWNGIKSMGAWLRSTLIGWAKNAIPGPIAKALGIASPSKVGVALGERFGQGMGIGIEQTRASVQRAAGRLAAATVAGPAGGRAGTAGTAGPMDVVLSVERTGDALLDALLEQLRVRIRRNGGNVQTVLGSA